MVAAPGRNVADIGRWHRPICFGAMGCSTACDGPKVCVGPMGCDDIVYMTSATTSQNDVLSEHEDNYHDVENMMGPRSANRLNTMMPLETISKTTLKQNVIWSWWSDYTT